MYDFISKTGSQKSSILLGLQKYPHEGDTCSGARSLWFAYLWPVLLFLRLRSSSADEPGQESRRSSLRPLYSRRWPCRRPGSSALRRRSGEPRSSCGPAGPPAAGCPPVCGSKHQENDTYLTLLNDVWTLRCEYAWSPSTSATRSAYQINNN